MMSSSSKHMMVNGIIVTILLLCGLAVQGQISNGPVGQWTFGPCAADVQAYFADIYPEFVSSRRRLREETAPSDDISTFSSRAKTLFERTHDRNEGGAQTAASSTDSTSEETTGLQGLAGKLPRSRPTGNYLPPVGAWDRARMAAAGCTSCTNGCCDAVDITLDCGSMRAPLDYSSAAINITLRTYRVRLTAPALVPPQRKHLWILQGGPGGSGLSILFLAVPSLIYATDIYVPDHRGTGRSTPLSCATQQATGSSGGSGISTSEVTPCYNSGLTQNLDFKLFTVTNAARDLGLMITSAKALASPSAVFVHGYSYGTRWASRFLQVYPNLADKVVLEGVVMKTTYFNDFAIGSQIAGTRYMTKCLSNALCSQFFDSPTLAAKINAISADGADNPCSALWVGTDTSPSEIRFGVQILLYTGLQSGVDGPYKNPTTNEDEYVDFRTFTLAMVHRWTRCKSSTDDLKAFTAGVAFILSLNGGLTASSTSARTEPSASVTSADLFNDIVYGVIAYSDLRRYPVESATAYANTFGNIDWGQVETYNVELATSNAWENIKYGSDGFMGSAPTNVQSKILVINGEIDGQTPRTHAYQQFSDITVMGAGTKTMAVINDMGHSASGFGCGLTVVKTFLESTADTTCAITDENEAIRPLSTGFTIPSRFSALLLGSPSSPWTGYDAGSICQNPPAGNLDYCLRCFDNCLLLADLGFETNCVCVAKMSQCLSRAQISNAQDICSVVLSTYYAKFRSSDFSPRGECQAACVGESYLGVLNGLTIGLIAFGSLCGVALLACVFVVVRNSRSKSSGGSVLSNTQSVPTTTAVVVNVPPGTNAPVARALPN